MKCKKIEDFDGMENGLGLKLKVEDLCFNNSKIELTIVIYDSKNKIQSYRKLNDNDILFLKEIGFKFEWKPKLSLEEVLKKYKSKPFKYGDKNFYLTYDERTGLYCEAEFYFAEFIGANCYDRETLNKIVEELNR